VGEDLGENKGWGHTSISVNPAHLLNVHRGVPLDFIEGGLFGVGHGYEVVISSV